MKSSSIDTAERRLYAFPGRVLVEVPRRQRDIPCRVSSDAYPGGLVADRRHTAVLLRALRQTLRGAGRG